MPFKPKNRRYWRYDFQIGGRRFYGSCKTENFEEAKAVEADVRTKAKSSASELTRFTVSQALGTYWDDVCKYQPSASTAKSQARKILKNINGKLFVDELKTADIVRMVAKFRATVTNATSNRCVEMLKRSIEHMVAYGAKVPKIDWKKSKTPEPPERVRELSYAEQDRLFEHVRPDLLPMVQFALMTGKRREEICSLKWSDIKTETQRIHFKVKGGGTHRFPINREIQALLSGLPKSNVIHARPYVFTFLSEDGERYPIVSSGGYIWTLWRDALKKAEIDDFRFHDFRHTFATRLLRQTGNLKLVSRLLGHSNIESTMKYAHVLDDDMAAAMDAFSSASPNIIANAGRKTQ